MKVSLRRRVGGKVWRGCLCEVVVIKVNSVLAVKKLHIEANYANRFTQAGVQT